MKEIYMPDYKQLDLFEKTNKDTKRRGCGMSWLANIAEGLKKHPELNKKLLKELQGLGLQTKEPNVRTGIIDEKIGGSDVKS